MLRIALLMLAAAAASAEELAVTSTADDGEGSLRQAIVRANAREGPDTITFDRENGPFATPQTIVLRSELPDLRGELTLDGTIEGRLWKPTGVTVSGNRERRVFRVGPGARVVLANLTLAHGQADVGGGIVNAGELVIKGVTFLANTAALDGGGLANRGGMVAVINSTFTANGAAARGGGLANLTGTATVTNATFSGNRAARGGGLFSAGKLLLRNTILANSVAGTDCTSSGTWHPAGTHNLIEANAGCGTPISTADPRLGPFAGYNGPTPTFPLGGGSPAINRGDNDSAVDEKGAPLIWDQRGNGDPRFVGGITDLGAFEQQALPQLVVDTAADTEARRCTRAGAEDCSLRGALTLANAMARRQSPGRRQPACIGFADEVFADGRPVRIETPLPALAAGVVIDAGRGGAIRLHYRGEFAVFRLGPGGALELRGITLRHAESPADPRHRDPGPASTGRAR